MRINWVEIPTNTKMKISKQFRISECDVQKIVTILKLRWLLDYMCKKLYLHFLSSQIG